MAKLIHNLEVLRVMSERNMDIRLAPLNNILRARHTKHGTQVTISVEGNVVGSIVNGTVVGGFILANKEQFDALKTELEAAP